MFSVAILMGVYSYLIFTLGLLHQLNEAIIFAATIIFFFLFVLLHRKLLLKSPKHFYVWLTTNLKQGPALAKTALLLIILQVATNLIGALGPEIAFDALWYHLTLPKMYLESHSISFIPGGLLYYSAMPKLTEMLYVVALAFGTEILAKLIHFSFGILTLIALYRVSRKFFTHKEALLVLVIFYSNLVVAWQSITAYVDLTRTFYELLALWGFVNFVEKKERKWLMLLALMVGFAISTKLLSIGSLFIFVVIIFAILFHHPRSPFGHLGGVMKVLAYLLVALFVPLPWLIFSYVNTGNPMYPFFTKIYEIGFDMSLVNPVRFVKDIWSLFLYSADPINPLYIIIVPLLLMLFKKFDTRLKWISLYSLLALLIWYITPRTGGGRFILPYLPAFSILAVATVKHISEDWFKKFLIMVIIFASVLSIGYRFLANKKYIPVILGIQSKDEFLSKNLNFSFGDFYDTDGYFAGTIKPNDKVLTYGIHNLYYVYFPFIHESYVKPGDAFNYILVQYGELPDRFKNTPDGTKGWKLMYENDRTQVKLYSERGNMWIY